MYLEVIFHNIPRRNFISEICEVPVQKMDFFLIDVEFNFRAVFIVTSGVSSVSSGEKQSLNFLGNFRSLLPKLNLHLQLSM
jgi:hypothetical protein